MSLAIIALGGAIGSVLRYLLGSFVQRMFNAGFPVGTFAVNVVGCLLAGILTRYFLNTQTELQIRTGLIVGFCGGFTTFSTFSVETLGLMQGGELLKAIGYVLLSVCTCVVATAAGYSVAYQLHR